MQVIDVLQEISRTTARKGQKACLPIKTYEFANYDKVMSKLATHGDENSAPELHLFFQKNGAFQVAEVSADDRILHLEAASLINALVTFIGVFYVFHVGYAPPHECLLLALQHVFLQDKEMPKNIGLGLKQFLVEFDKNLAEAKDTRRVAKRLSISGGGDTYFR